VFDGLVPPSFTCGTGLRSRGLCKRRLSLAPLSSERGTHETVKARLLPWLEPFSVRPSLRPIFSTTVLKTIQVVSSPLACPLLREREWFLDKRKECAFFTDRNQHGHLVFPSVKASRVRLGPSTRRESYRLRDPGSAAWANTLFLQGACTAS